MNAESSTVRMVLATHIFPCFGALRPCPIGKRKPLTARFQRRSARQKIRLPARLGKNTERLPAAHRYSGTQGQQAWGFGTKAAGIIEGDATTFSTVCFRDPVKKLH